jgi:hypothetical protein
MARWINSLAFRSAPGLNADSQPVSRWEMLGPNNLSLTMLDQARRQTATEPELEPQSLGKPSSVTLGRLFRIHYALERERMGASESA